MAYPKAKTRDLFSALRTLHNVQSNTPKDTMPESVGWIMREMRDELARRDYSADNCGDVLNGRHVIFFPDREDWLKVYPLKDVDPWEDRAHVEDLFRVYYLKRCTSPYDCSGEVFTQSFHVFKRRGAWWAYEWLALNV